MAKKNQAQQFFTDQASMAQEERFLAQCFLMQNINRLLKDRASKKEDCYTNFITVDGDPSAFLGRVLRKSRQELFLQEIQPHELSALVPKMRLFRVLYDPVNPNSYQESEYFFDTTLTNDDVLSITRSNSRKSTGVGLKSCTWEFIGSNPAESKRLIKVNLKVFFSSMQDLVKKSPTGLAFLDLIKPIGKDNSGQLDPKNHQVKLEVGWACPPNSHALFQGKKDLLEAIKNASLSMFVSLTTHNLEFKQDGRVLLDINFWGRLESGLEAGGNTRFDILEVSESDKVQQQRNSFKLTQKEIKARMQLLDCVAKNAQKTGDRVTLRNVKRELDRVTKQNQENLEERKRFLLSEQKIKYEKMIKALLKSNKIHYISVSQQALGVLDDKTLKRRAGSGRSVGKCNSAEVDTQHAKFLKNYQNLSKLNTSKKGVLSNKKLLDSRLPRFDGCVLIHYFYLGDLLNIVLEDFYKTPSKQKKEIFTKFLVGSISNPIDPKKKINLANIPISLQLFSIWFSKKVIQRSRETYPFNEFIRDVLIGLIQPIMNDKCLQNTLDSTKRNNQTRIRPRITLFQLEGQGKNGRVDPILRSARLQELDRATKKAIKTGRLDGLTGFKQNEFGQLIQQCQNRLSSDSISTVRVGQNSTSSSPCLQNKRAPLFDYFFMYTTEEQADYRTADYIKDQEDGIYHFFVGSDRGLVKEIKFKQNTQPYLKEAIMQGTGLEWLKRLYDADITMYGNASFIPGQKIFINPTTVGLGEPYNANSIASQMGLGGYYVIIKVSGHIESGQFETKLTCKWESRGDGTGFKTEPNQIDDCIQRYKKTVGNASGRFFQSPDSIKRFFRSQSVVQPKPNPIPKDNSSAIDRINNLQLSGL